MISATLLLLSASDQMLAAPHIATLGCGSSMFRLESRQWADRRASPLAPSTQSLSVEVAGRQRSVKLAPTPMVRKGGYSVRNRYVLSWACLTNAANAHYLVLGYACAIERGYPHDCGGEQEWARFLDDRGRAVDTGVSHDGDRPSRLMQRLGLQRQLTNGIHMIDVLE